MIDTRKELKEIVSSIKGHLIYQRDILLADGIPVAERGVRSAELSPPLPGPPLERAGVATKNLGSLQDANEGQSTPPIPLFSKEGERGGVDKERMPKAGALSDSHASHASLLEQFMAEIGDCQKCKLGKTRTNLVFGVGNPDARIVFVGEGPGRDEDIRGEPFVGKAGQLLTDIITKGMKMRREDVYICNVVKCRPPENRNPEPDEIDACERFLIKQLEIIKPQIIIALGTFAAQTLLKTELPISKLRGRFHDYKGIKVMPTFHPSFLLRNPEKKKEVWEDIKMVLAELG